MKIVAYSKTTWVKWKSMIIIYAGVLCWLIACTVWNNPWLYSFAFILNVLLMQESAYYLGKKHAIDEFTTDMMRASEELNKMVKRLDLDIKLTKHEYTPPPDNVVKLH